MIAALKKATILHRLVIDFDIGLRSLIGLLCRSPHNERHAAEKTSWVSVTPIGSLLRKGTERRVWFSQSLHSINRFRSFYAIGVLHGSFGLGPTVLWLFRRPPVDQGCAVRNVSQLAARPEFKPHLND
jgi:hypothetical protein